MARFMGPTWWPTGPRWVPCGPREPCYLGSFDSATNRTSSSSSSSTSSIRYFLGGGGQSSDDLACVPGSTLTVGGWCSLLLKCLVSFETIESPTSAVMQPLSFTQGPNAAASCRKVQTCWSVYLVSKLVCIASFSETMNELSVSQGVKTFCSLDMIGNI